MYGVSCLPVKRLMQRILLVGDAWVSTRHCLDHVGSTMTVCQFAYSLLLPNILSSLDIVNTESKSLGSSQPSVCRFQVEDVASPHITASFRQFQVEQIASDAKESACRALDIPFFEADNANIPNVTYEVSGQ